jgi:hypothetical protein
MRGRRELKSMWRDPRMKELIDSLWREYYGLYTEKYKSQTELDELGEPIDQWLRNSISRDINFAQALGQDHLLEGNRSAAFGQGAVTKSFMEIVLGAYNVIPEGQNAEEWIPTDLLLSLGNGPDEDNRSNVFEVYKNGFFKFLQSVKIGAHHTLIEGEIIPNGTLQWTPENGLEEWDTDHWKPIGGSTDPDTITPFTENTTSDGKHTHKFEPGTTITQAAHGFTIGTAIKLYGSVWVKAKADIAANAGTVGLVSEVIDADHFKYVTGGLLPGNYTIGALYYLSTTVAGTLMIVTDESAWNLGEIVEFIGTGTAAGLEIEIDLGYEITEAIIPKSIWDLEDVDRTGWAEGKLLKFDANGNLVVGVDLQGLLESGIHLTDLSAIGAIHYDPATGVFSIASGYIVPTTTEKGHYDTAFSWGNHADAGYLTAITKAMVEAVLTGQISSHTHNYLTAITKAMVEAVLTGEVTSHTHPLYSLLLAANGTRGGIQIGFAASGANLPLLLSAEKAYIALTKAAIEAVLTGAITSHTHSYLTAITKAMVEAVLTGIISSHGHDLPAHDHDYDKYEYFQASAPGCFVGNVYSKDYLSIAGAAGGGISVYLEHVSNTHKYYLKLDINALNQTFSADLNYWIPVAYGIHNSKITIAELKALIGGGGVSDHGALSGLADDDHTQYFNQTRGDARFAQLAGSSSQDFATKKLTAAETVTATGEVKGEKFTLGTSGWSFEVSSGSLVIKHNGTALMSLDTSGNIKAASEIYRGGL